jgi:hypothetical protein
VNAHELVGGIDFIRVVEVPNSRIKNQSWIFHDGEIRAARCNIDAKATQSSTSQKVEAKQSLTQFTPNGYPAFGWSQPSVGANSTISSSRTTPSVTSWVRFPARADGRPSPVPT